VTAEAGAASGSTAKGAGTIGAMAAELGVSRDMVSKWRSRFLRDRLEGRIRPLLAGNDSGCRMIFGGKQMQKVDVQLEDDLTGGPADETLAFGVDGRDYEIDLNAKHAATFRRQLGAFVERARLVPRHRWRSTPRSAATRERSRQIRAWAERRGFEVAEHGRLPAHVVQEYERAHADAQPAMRERRIASSRTRRKH
jgi:hypothetical protein